MQEPGFELKGLTFTDGTPLCCECLQNVKNPKDGLSVREVGFGTIEAPLIFHNKCAISYFAQQAQVCLDIIEQIKAHADMGPDLPKARRGI